MPLKSKPRQVMLTILEGPDCCGKSTLIDRLMKEKVAQWQQHFTHAPDVGVELIHQYLAPLRFPPRAARHLIYDRSWISEPIYGQVMRAGADRIGISGRRYLERVAFSRGGVVLMPAATLEECATRYAARRNLEYLDSEAKLRQVYDLYAQLGERTALPAFVVDPAIGGVELMERLQQERPLLNRGPGIGHWNPGKVTLLVGEQTNGQGDAEDVPFVSPANRADGCAFWLTWNLEQWGVSERDLYWINALNRDDTTTDPAFLADLQPRKVIALGKAAEHWCGKVAKLDKFQAVEHPQYWKRFRHQEPYPLKELLA